MTKVGSKRPNMTKVSSKRPIWHLVGLFWKVFGKFGRFGSIFYITELMWAHVGPKLAPRVKPKQAELTKER